MNIKQKVVRWFWLVAWEFILKLANQSCVFRNMVCLDYDEVLGLLKKNGVKIQPVQSVEMHTLPSGATFVQIRFYMTECAEGERQGLLNDLVHLHARDKEGFGKLF